MSKIPGHLLQAIEERKRKGLFRRLKNNLPEIDFASNDYLGFSKTGLLYKKINELFPQHLKTGSTGSRLISGNSVFTEETENLIASFHKASSALIYNSGYDANVGLMSSVPQKGDLILFDELIHASLYDGIRLSNAQHYKFKHNSIAHLEELLIRHHHKFKSVFVVVETVYSMDGDCAPLREIVNLKNKYNLFLIADEAHALGVFGKQGKGLCSELNVESDFFARIYTYGKAMGCHGASVVCDEVVKTFLINFSRSFIYTTALPPHSIATINAAYHLLKKTKQIDLLKGNINYFVLKSAKISGFISSSSAIHCKLINGNDKVDEKELLLAKSGFFIKSVKSPTVKEGQERVRICLHAFNSKKEIDNLLKLVK